MKINKKRHASNSYSRYVGEQFFKSREACFGVCIFGIIVLFALLVPILSPYDYSEQNASMRNLSTSLTHLFGTDKFGRDLFTRIWYGTRISLGIGVFSTIINLGVGVLYGGIAGYIGGKVDFALMQVADMIAAIPSLLYVILITLVSGASMGSMILGICVSGWIGLARVVRGEIMKLKEMEFCLAAKVSGVKASRILFHHLLINAAGPIIVTVMFMIPQAIFTESFLSFVGVGIAAPMASLGTLIQDARGQIQLYPMQMVYPIVILCVLIIALNFIGNGLLKAME